MICGDLNDHNGNLANGYQDVPSEHGYSFKNMEKEIIFKLAFPRSLLVRNLYPIKKDNRLIIYQSNGISSQIESRWYMI